MRSAKGGQIALGGKRHALGGTFFEPTVITQVKPNMLVAREETFGPVAPVFSFKDEKEAIRMANDTEFGLASYFYTRDLARSFRVAEALEYGIVGLNTGLISTEVAPFGGDKGIRRRSRRLQVRHPGLHRAQVFVHRWHRGLSDRALASAAGRDHHARIDRDEHVHPRPCRRYARISMPASPRCRRHSRSRSSRSRSASWSGDPSPIASAGARRYWRASRSSRSAPRSG